MKGNAYRKIAVLRANAVGDFIFALPALEAMRAAYPDSEIVLLGKEWHHRFLEKRPSPVDRVAVVPLCRGVNEERVMEEDAEEIERFCERMRAERFDLALQLHGGGRYSNPFLKRLGARCTAGLKAEDATPLDRWVPYIYFQPEILRYLEVVSLVGATAVTLEPRVTVTEADIVEGHQWLAPSHEDFAMLNPGAGDGRRRWPPDKFAEICDTLRSDGIEVVVHGSPWEHELVDAVAGCMRTDPIVLCGNLSLGGLAGVLSRCRLLISNDTGPLHLAAAVSTPTVGIYWCGNLINSGPMTRSLHRPLVSWRLDCTLCGRSCIYDNCEHHESFVSDIAADEVLMAARDLLHFPRAQPRI